MKCSQSTGCDSTVKPQSGTGKSCFKMYVELHGVSNDRYQTLLAHSDPILLSSAIGRYDEG